MFQKRRLRLDTNSKCQYSHIDDDFDFGIKKTDTYSQGYYCRTKTKVGTNKVNTVNKVVTNKGAHGE